jgi:anaerobic ribonucleoside-triphosphate reductase activating protein
MYYGVVKKTDIADGPGVRVCLYVSGCRRHCPGCHNPETWDFKYGKEYTAEVEQEILEAMNHDYIQGFTFCGGEPFEEENQRVIVELVRKIRERFPEKDVWSWTGYEYDDLLEGGMKHCEVTDELLSYIDVLVVGKFILALRDITDNNRWRGSLNQRVIDMNKTREEGHPVMLAGVPNNE